MVALLEEVAAACRRIVHGAVVTAGWANWVGDLNREGEPVRVEGRLRLHRQELRRRWWMS
jgi:hypothetical protein